MPDFSHRATNWPQTWAVLLLRLNTRVSGRGSGSSDFAELFTADDSLNDLGSGDIAGGER